MVLRRWLRGDTETPTTEFDRALARATEPLRPAPVRPHEAYAPVGPADPITAETARHSVALLEELLPALRRLADGSTQ